MESVTLAGRDYTVAKPKLRQLRVIVDRLDAMAGKSGGALIDGAVGVIVGAAEVGVLVPPGEAPYAELTEAALLDAEIGFAELNAVVGAIVRASGLKAADEPGEAEPPPAA